MIKRKAERQPMPVYDARRDGHPYRWILRAADEVRLRRLKERQAEYLRNHTALRPLLPIQRPPMEDEH